MYLPCLVRPEQVMPLVRPLAFQTELPAEGGQRPRDTRSRMGAVRDVAPSPTRGRPHTVPSHTP